MNKTLSKVLDKAEELILRHHNSHVTADELAARIRVQDDTKVKRKEYLNLVFRTYDLRIANERYLLDTKGNAVEEITSIKVIINNEIVYTFDSSKNGDQSTIHLPVAHIPSLLN